MEILLYENLPFLTALLLVGGTASLGLAANFNARDSVQEERRTIWLRGSMGIIWIAGAGLFTAVLYRMPDASASTLATLSACERGWIAEQVDARVSITNQDVVDARRFCNRVGPDSERAKEEREARARQDAAMMPTSTP